MIFACSTHMLMKCWINVSFYQTGWCWTCSSQLNCISLQSDFLYQQHPLIICNLLEIAPKCIRTSSERCVCKSRTKFFVSLHAVYIRYPSCTSRLFVSFVQYHFLSSKSWGMVWPKIKPQKPSQGIKLDRLCFQKWIVLTLRKVNNKRYCKMKHKIIKKCITMVLKWQQNECGWIKFGPLKCYDRVKS